MATTPTQKPIPSNDIIDLKFNAEKIDEVVNSDFETYIDRFGIERYTLDGIRKNLAPLGKAYTKEQAASAIASGEIKEGDFFFIWSDNDETIADQYKNISGVAVFQGYGFVRSKLVTDLYQEIGIELYTQSANVDNYYVVAGGANAGKLLPTSSSPTVVTYFPVFPGQTYIVKASDFRTDFFAVALKADNQLTETTLGLVSLSGTGSYRAFTVPVGSSAKFAFVNVMITNGGFDIRNSISISVDVVKFINGIAIYDDYARNKLLDDNISLIEDDSGQIYNSLNNRAGYYVRATGANAGDILPLTGTVLNTFPISAGKTYTIQASSFEPNYFAVTLKNDNQVTGPTLGLVTLTGSGNTRSFTVPSGSAAKFAFMNVYLPGPPWDIRPTLSIVGPVQKMSALKSYGLVDTRARQLIAEIDGQKKLTNQREIMGCCRRQHYGKKLQDK